MSRRNRLAGTSFVVASGSLANGVTSTQTSDLSSTLNPKYVPPKGAKCPIETLPPEVLTCIFEIGTRAEEADDQWNKVEEDDGDAAYEDVDSDDESAGEWEDEDEGEDKGRGREIQYCTGPGEGFRLARVKITEDKKKTSADADGGREKSMERKIANEDEDDEEISGEKVLPFQVRMSHVCHRWREAALETPTLWTNLTFREPAPFEKSIEWIRRSKSCPLDIRIDLTLPEESMPLVQQAAGGVDADGENQDEGEGGGGTAARTIAEETVNMAASDLAKILDIVLPHVDRWRKFDLSVDIYKLMYYTLKCLSNPKDTANGAPMLEELSLFCHDESEDVDYEHFLFTEYQGIFRIFGGNFPKLARLDLWGVHLDWRMFVPQGELDVRELEVFPSATTNLTEIELSYHAKDVRPDFYTFANILRCATQLHTLIISCSGFSQLYEGPSPQPLYLPTLRTLRLAFVPLSYAQALVRLLYAPGLTKLDLDFDDEDFTPLIEQLAAPMVMPSPVPRYDDPNRPPPKIYLNSSKAVGKDVLVVDPSHPRSLLEYVTHMKLAGLPCSDAVAPVLFAACRSLCVLHLNMHFLPMPFFSTLMQYTEERSTRIVVRPSYITPEALFETTVEDTTKKAVAPLLEMLTVSGMDGAALRELVQTRKALGTPIRALYIDQEDLLQLADYEWLKRNVESLELVELSDDEGEDDEVDDEEEDEEDEGDGNSDYGEDMPDLTDDEDDELLLQPGGVQ